MGKQRYAELYRWIIAGVGSLVCLFSAARLPLDRIDMRFLLLTMMTVIVSSRIAVQIPRFDTNVTVSDTFIFLAILLYGGEAGILLAAAEGLCSGIRISKSKKPVTILFSGAVMACSTFVTVWTLRFAFRMNEDLYRHTSSLLLTVLCTMALAQYISNTGLVAVGLAFKTDQPIWQTWSKHYLWTSITYIVGADAAAITAEDWPVK